MSKSSRPQSHCHLAQKDFLAENSVTLVQNHQPSESCVDHEASSANTMPRANISHGGGIWRQMDLENTPEQTLPITPMMKDVAVLDNVMNLDGLRCESEGETQIFGLQMMQDFGMYEVNSLGDFGDLFNPTGFVRDSNDQYPIIDKTALTFASQLLSPTTDFQGPNSFKFPNMSQLNFNMPNENSMHTIPNHPLHHLLGADAVVLAQQWWPYFQCNRTDKSAAEIPETADIYLNGLVHTLRNPITWQTWSSLYLVDNMAISEHQQPYAGLGVGWPREKLLALAQIFLLEALSSRRNDQSILEGIRFSGSVDTEDSCTLPPPKVIHHFLHSYMRHYECYYLLLTGSAFDPNEMMHDSNSRFAALITLLMTACGASVSPTTEARLWTSGVAEACRISILDSIEEDMSQAGEVLVLRAAFLFTCLAAWSGDNRHMDVALRQRDLSITLLSQSGMLGPFGTCLETLSCEATPQKACNDWKEHESQHKLVHSWILLDQELSLFCDMPPSLSIVNLDMPVSDPNDLWQAQSAEDWLDYFETRHILPYQTPPSLRDLFGKFVEGSLDSTYLSPTNLRLLLYPLQEQMSELKQFMTSGRYATTQYENQCPSDFSCQARKQELAILLKRWYEMSKNTFSSDREICCWTTHASLIMYHLIALNNITNFKCIEQFARKETAATPSDYISWLQTRCVEQPEEVFFHCGQVLRLLRCLPTHAKPPWWSGAVYRVALIAWAASFANAGPRYDGGEVKTTICGFQFAIDDLPPEHQTIDRYLKYHEGTPMFTNLEGLLIPLDTPNQILMHCAEFLGQDLSMRLADGIRRKLCLLAQEWSDF